MSFYGDVITKAIPTDLQTCADPVTLEMIEWCMRVERTALNHLSTEDFAHDVPAILRELLSNPTEAQLVLGAIQLPAPAWLTAARHMATDDAAPLVRQREAAGPRPVTTSPHGK